MRRGLTEGVVTLTTDHVSDSRTAGEHFLGFIVSLLNLAEGKYQQWNQVKANSVTFHILVVLSQSGRPAPTISELTSGLEITKQQLAKLVNDLEKEQLVEKQHDHRNRRQAYLAIAPTGTRTVQQLRETMLGCTMAELSGFARGELSEMDDCLVRLSALLDKFDPRKPQDMDRGDLPQIQDLRNLTQYTERPLPLTGNISASGQGQRPCYI